MKGIILVPTMNEGYASIGRYVNLFNIIKKDLNFEIKFTNECNLNDLNKYDVVIIFKSPENHVPDLMKDIVNLNSDVKLIGYWTDIHSIEYPNDRYFNNLEAIFNRCDRILCAYKESFLKKWPEYEYKFNYFPHFVEFIINNTDEKINKCLLTGAICNKFYPLRHRIKEDKYLRGKFLDVLNHPGYNTNDDTALKKGLKIGKSYYETINRYFCSIATSGIENYTLGKYFEIPASGSLLVANTINDLTGLGFIENVNYISIDEYNYRNVIKNILLHPTDLNDIVKSGQALIKNNYTINHSVEKLKRIIYEVCSL